MVRHYFFGLARLQLGPWARHGPLQLQKIKPSLAWLAEDGSGLSSACFKYCIIIMHRNPLSM